MNLLNTERIQKATQSNFKTVSNNVENIFFRIITINNFMTCGLIWCQDEFELYFQIRAAVKSAPRGMQFRRKTI